MHLLVSSRDSGSPSENSRWPEPIGSQPRFAATCFTGAHMSSDSVLRTSRVAYKGSTSLSIQLFNGLFNRTVLDTESCNPFKY